MEQLLCDTIWLSLYKYSHRKKLLYLDNIFTDYVEAGELRFSSIVSISIGLKNYLEENPNEKLPC